MSNGQNSALSADPTLNRAINYALSNPGKRLRAQLTEAAAYTVAGQPVAAAGEIGDVIELLHTYSLIHDDLPAMDNDDLRRGQPTLHRAFDEATAILVGDGLQTLAFERITICTSLSVEQRLSLVALLSRAAGFAGMVGGQAMDMAGEQQTLAIEQLRALHSLKTGALITAALEAGGLCAGANSVQMLALRTFGEAIGLAFQVTDDILDVTQDSATLGKTAGKDIDAAKSTYVACLGLEGAKNEADRLLTAANSALIHFGEDAAQLRTLADKIVKRSR